MKQKVKLNPDRAIVPIFVRRDSIQPETRVKFKTNKINEIDCLLWLLVGLAWGVMISLMVLGG